jgi:hypothetical protein
MQSRCLGSLSLGRGSGSRRTTPPPSREVDAGLSPGLGMPGRTALTRSFQPDGSTEGVTPPTSSASSSPPRAEARALSIRTGVVRLWTLLSLNLLPSSTRLRPPGRLRVDSRPRTPRWPAQRSDCALDQVERFAGRGRCHARRGCARKSLGAPSVPADSSGGSEYPDLQGF